jgi:hypothetical protein
MLTRLSGPRSRPTATQKIWPRQKPREYIGMETDITPRETDVIAVHVGGGGVGA